MIEELSRIGMLIGEAGVERLANSKIAVFGVGGVGGYVCEALVRSGIGSIDLCDNDTVSLSNINRQLIATHSTVGQSKVKVMKDRLLDINPEIKINTYECFYLPELGDSFDFSQYDYVVDAIDTVAAKIDLAVRCEALGVPLISSMGTGNKLDPTKLVVTDIYKTKVCPLAKVMRHELKKRGVSKLKVVYSEELPIKPDTSFLTDNSKNGRSPGSTAFVPPAAGMIIASEIVRYLISLDTFA